MPKIAIVTGASRGIGRAVAKRLARDGFAVAVNYASSAKEADATVAEIKSDGGQALAVKADVGSAAEVEQMFDQTIKAFGSVDVVVNNSGIMPLSPIGKGDVALFDRVIQTNLRRTFLVMAQAAQRMAEGGRFIAFSSSVLARSFPTYGAYIASKAGVEGLVHVLANEMRGRNITVNAVAPGPVGTELFQGGISDAAFLGMLGVLAAFVCCHEHLSLDREVVRVRPVLHPTVSDGSREQYDRTGTELGV